MERKGKILKKCPICGMTLEVHVMMQYTNVYRLKRNGEPSEKRIRKDDGGSMECFYLCCTNNECDFVTDCDLTPVNYNNFKIWQIGDKLYYDIFEE
ncbi:MAG: hypothetical protein K2K56_11195 [Lachnospiraceae bacterium]|nr:hypothetical protein [Lachnospiraceae bacterium]